MAIKINTKGIEKAHGKNKDQIDAILRTQMNNEEGFDSKSPIECINEMLEGGRWSMDTRKGGITNSELEKYKAEEGEIVIPVNNTEPNSYIENFTNELLNEREKNEIYLNDFEELLKKYQKSKTQVEKRIDEIDKALITLGYKGDEVE